MDCRLTLIGLIVAIFVGKALGEPAQPPSAHEAHDRDSQAVGDAVFSVHWEGLPLRDAVARLVETSKVVVFVDRRVDPDQLVNLSVEIASADEILDKLAANQSLGASRLNSLRYLGPVHAAAELYALAELRHADISRLSPLEQQAWSKSTSIAWPRLTEPRDLVARFLNDHELQMTSGEQIPYDLWPAGRLPNMSMVDGLTVLLFGFDLTFRPVPGERAIEIIPISEPVATALQAAAPAKQVRPTPGTKQNTKQLFTLRVQQQPVGKVIEQLERQLHLDVKLDEAAIQAAGRSLDERISFEVNDVDLDGLLAAVLKPAGLTFERDGEHLTIKPR
ncbi:MAG TPA: hypothetical protein VGM76_12240 [Lacipirellulaceae bacterium]